jgi:hypothetical protein
MVGSVHGGTKIPILLVCFWNRLGQMVGEGVYTHTLDQLYMYIGGIPKKNYVKQWIGPWIVLYLYSLSRH